MRRLAPLVVMSIVLFALPADAVGQHSSFALFGEPNPAAADSPGEHRFVHPITSPYYHEDSFVTTDLRLWYVYHDFPRASLIDGGHAQVAAVQARLAITPWLQLVAYKDGYVWFDSGLLDEDGWNDIGAGLKFNFIQDFKNQFHASVGAGYEFPWGDPGVLQNDSNVRLWLSANKGFERLHLGATANFLISTGDTDTLGDSDRFFWHVHADYYLCSFFSPVIEFNGYHAFDEDEQVVPFSGIDVANLGGGDDVVTFGVGAEIRPLPDDPRLGLRFAYETPLTTGDDLFGFRWTFSLVWSF